uniref:Uncharacterized protein n=1 Tax=Tanacetum cinerariifolium TaxID=118510 RepID=A0A699GTK4_TANCI|nr:hypothetical protein [Tanacetum cinerariifolium]
MNSVGHCLLAGKVIQGTADQQRPQGGQTDLSISEEDYLYGTLSNIQGVCGALNGAITHPDDQVTPNLVKQVQMGDFQVNISGSSGELDETPTLPDVRDMTKTMETNLVRSWSHAILDLTSVLTPSLLFGHKCLKGMLDPIMKLLA